ncbi:MAG: DNA helicase RecQ [Candidatus Puniceispirillaceae bacterium]
MIADNQQALISKLQTVFGFSDFRPGQLDIVSAILEGQNILAIMPTGAGKSLCYQLPAVMRRDKTVIISPLVALMTDQVASLKETGVRAEMLHSGRLYDDNVISWRRFASDDTNIIYMSPERLMQPRMIAALQKLPIGLFVIDEAHCISKWGAGFRPDYEALSTLKIQFPSAQIAAFTATADKATRDDINDKLTQGDATTFIHGFDRPNLSLAVLPKQSVKEQITDFVKHKEGQSGIIYCLSRRETDELAAHLRAQNIQAMAYHAGMSQEERAHCQDRFMTDDGVIMVATIAFGMGIDKPDIRFVIHASLPSSVEAFYQEIGRAGRDGNASETLLFYSLQDMIKRQRMIFESEGNDQYKFGENARLEALLGYCEATSCRRQVLLSYFDETMPACGNCDNCLSPPALIDYSVAASHIIEAIYQSGQFFGASHILDIVRGAQTAKVKDKNHDILSSFGKGKARSKSFYQTLLRQLIARGVITVNLARYGALELAREAEAIISGQNPFMAGEIKDKQSVTGMNKSRAPLIIRDEDAGLIGQLKALRLQLAQEKNVPAYVIFTDRAIIQMAEQKPQTKDDFLRINGVGPKKVDSYFEVFSEVIERYLLQAG